MFLFKKNVYFVGFVSFFSLAITVFLNPMETPSEKNIERYYGKQTSEITWSEYLEWQFRNHQLPEPKKFFRQVETRELCDQTFLERTKDDLNECNGALVDCLKQRCSGEIIKELIHHPCISLEYCVDRLLPLIDIDLGIDYCCLHNLLSSRLVLWLGCNSIDASRREAEAAEYEYEIQGNYLSLLSALERIKCAHDLRAQDFANLLKREKGRLKALLNQSASSSEDAQRMCKEIVDCNNYKRQYRWNKSACEDLAEEVGKKIDNFKKSILRKNKPHKDKLWLVVLAAMRSYEESRSYGRYLMNGDEPHRGEFSFFMRAELEKHRSWLFGKRETQTEQEQVQYVGIEGQGIACCTVSFKIDGESVQLSWEFSSCFHN